MSDYWILLSVQLQLSSSSSREPVWVWVCGAFQSHVQIRVRGAWSEGLLDWQWWRRLGADGVRPPFEGQRWWQRLGGRAFHDLLGPPPSAALRIPWSSEIRKVIARLVQAVLFIFYAYVVQFTSLHMPHEKKIAIFSHLWLPVFFAISLV
jgi:hypothetical protein